MRLWRPGSSQLCCHNRFGERVGGPPGRSGGRRTLGIFPFGPAPNLCGVTQKLRAVDILHKGIIPQIDHGLSLSRCQIFCAEIQIENTDLILIWPDPKRLNRIVLACAIPGHKIQNMRLSRFGSSRYPRHDPTTDPTGGGRIGLIARCALHCSRL